MPVSTKLNILPEESTLRNAGQFSKPLELDQTIRHQPRALRALSQIIEHGLCHRCGSCVGICPTGVLALDKQSYPSVKHLSACTDCDLCVRVCPGDEFDYQSFHRELFDVDRQLEDTHGPFRQALLSHAIDEEIRQGSTSGGFVTALLRSLLEQSEIDGAIVIRDDASILWKGAPELADTFRDLLSSMKSKYAISPTNIVFEAVLKLPGRYALVGLPCQIHGYHKARKIDPRIEERIVLTIGLFCHAAIEHQAFEVIWESLGAHKEKATQFISRIGKHPGSPHIRTSDGSLTPVYFPESKGYRPTSIEMINILYRLYTPERCMTCFDALADLADIGVGDPWLPPPSKEIDFHDGWSFVLLRTERGERAYEKIQKQGAVKSFQLTENEALSCNKAMAEEKRWRAFRVIETQKRQGRPVPSYGAPLESMPQHQGMQFVKTEINLLTHILCFLPKLRAQVLRFFLGQGGYRLLWINNKRRRLRVWLRDNLARVKRELLGRK